MSAGFTHKLQTTAPASNIPPAKGRILDDWILAQNKNKHKL